MCSKERGSLDLTDANGVWALFTLADLERDGITVGDFSGHFGDVNEEVGVRRPGDVLAAGRVHQGGNAEWTMIDV